MVTPEGSLARVSGKANMDTVLQSPQLEALQRSITAALVRCGAKGLKPHWQGKAFVFRTGIFGRRVTRYRKVTWWELGDECDEEYVLFADGGIGQSAPPLGMGVHRGMTDRSTANTWLLGNSTLVSVLPV